MSEDKRFTEVISTGVVTDRETGKEYKCEMRIDDELLELINEIDRENKLLKLQIKMLEQVKPIKELPESITMVFRNEKEKNNL